MIKEIASLAAKVPFKIARIRFLALLVLQAAMLSLDKLMLLKLLGKLKIILTKSNLSKIREETTSPFSAQACYRVV